MLKGARLRSLESLHMFWVAFYSIYSPVSFSILGLEMSTDILYISFFFFFYIYYIVNSTKMATPTRKQSELNGAVH
jgi:hypothetical protein